MKKDQTTMSLLLSEMIVKLERTICSTQTTYKIVAWTHIGSNTDQTTLSLLLSEMNANQERTKRSICTLETYERVLLQTANTKIKCHRSQKQH